MSEHAIPVIDPEKTAKNLEAGRRMREGRRRAAALRASQPRSAADAKQAGVAQPPQRDTAAPIREAESGERLTRVPRGQRDIGDWTFPPHRRKPGWDYQLITIRIYNEPQSTAEYYRQGWRPVPSTEAPELLVPGEPSEHLDVKGMRWFWRPEQFSAQAREEDRSAAAQQQRDRIVGATEGRPAGDGARLADVAGVRPISLGTEVYGEIGSAPERRRG